MREIIQIQTGQCGNLIGTKFWDGVSSEHGISLNGTYAGHDVKQLEKVNVFYDENDRRFTPRCILIDLEPRILDNIRSGPFGQCFRPENFVTGQTGTGNE